MARPPRTDRPGRFYHVLNRTTARRPLFMDRTDARAFLARMVREIRRGRIAVHSYALMTTHYHLMVESRTGELPAAMHGIQNGHARRYNRRHRREGPLFRGRYRAKLLHDDRYRRALVRYIDFNPVKAQIVGRPWEYEWGSAMAYATDRIPRWLEGSWIMSEIAGDEGGVPERYGRCFGQPITEVERQLIEGTRTHSGTKGIADFVAASPEAVWRLMRYRARLADGLEASSSLDLRPLKEAAFELVKSEVLGALLESVDAKAARAIKVSLLRLCGGATWSQIGSCLGFPPTTCQRWHARHVALLRADRAYERLSRRVLAALVASRQSEMGTVPGTLPPVF